MWPARSVGVGALIAYLALDLAAATSSDIVVVRGAYTGMDVIVRYAIVPLALTSVVIGIINGLGTSWGLLRQYLVVAKLVLTVAAAGVLLVEAGLGALPRRRGRGGVRPARPEQHTAAFDRRADRPGYGLGVVGVQTAWTDPLRLASPAAPTRWPRCRRAGQPRAVVNP